jgi:anti-sigma28 factor (negative regulator of flagellin synthesis)
MEVNGPGPVNGGQPVQRTSQTTAAQSAEARPTAPKDELEISSTNSAASEVDLQAEFRAQRIAQIQQEITAGTYETSDKLESAVDRLMESLLAE